MIAASRHTDLRFLRYPHKLTAALARLFHHPDRFIYVSLDDHSGVGAQVQVP